MGNFMQFPSPGGLAQWLASRRRMTPFGAPEMPAAAMAPAAPEMPVANYSADVHADAPEGPSRPEEWLQRARQMGEQLHPAPQYHNNFIPETSGFAQRHPGLTGRIEGALMSALMAKPGDLLSGPRALIAMRQQRAAEAAALPGEQLKAGLATLTPLQQLTLGQQKDERDAQLAAAQAARDYAAAEKDRRTPAIPPSINQVVVKDDKSPTGWSQVSYMEGGPNGVTETGRIPGVAGPHEPAPTGVGRTTIFNGHNWQFNPETGKYDIDLGVAKPENSSISPTAGANLMLNLSKQWGALTKNAREMQQQATLMHSGMESAKQGNMAAGSQAVLVTFQKILDPNSVVRESEYARSGAGQSLYNRIEGAYTQLAQGGAGLTYKQLQQFADLADQFVRNATSAPNLINERARMTNVANAYGIQPEHIFGPDSALGTPAAGGAPPAANAPGTRPPLSSFER